MDVLARCSTNVSSQLRTSASVPNLSYIDDYNKLNLVTIYREENDG